MGKISILKTYYKLVKPWHIYGNAITAAAGYLFAASRFGFEFSALLTVLAGLSLVVAASCVLNNIYERDIDARMPRTRRRALVSGEVSVSAALVFAAALTIGGLALLAVYTNWLTACVAFAGLVLYALVYSYAKRRTVRGTEVGSISGGMPVVAGYTAASGQLDPAALLLFAVLVTYQMPHFYAVSVYRLSEYRAAGLPVLPLVKGVGATKTYMIVYIIAFIAVTVMFTVLGYAGITYLLSVLLAGWIWLGLAVRGLSGSENDKDWARRMLKMAVMAIVAFSVAIAADGFALL